MVADSHTNGTSVGTRTYDTKRVLAYVDHEPTECFLTQIMDMGDEIYKAVTWKAPSGTFTAEKKPLKSGKGSGQYAVKLRKTIGQLSHPDSDLNGISASDWVTRDGTKLPVQKLGATDAVKAMSSSATDVPTWLVFTFGHHGYDGLAEESLVSTAVTRGSMADFQAFFKGGDDEGKRIFKDDQVSHDSIKNNVMRLFLVADDDRDDDVKAVQGGNNDGDNDGGNNDGDNDGDNDGGNNDGDNDGEAQGGNNEHVEARQADAPKLAPFLNRTTDDQVVVGPPSNDEAHGAPPANPEEKIRNLEEEIRNLKEARDVHTAYIEELESTIFGMIRAHNKYVNNCVNSGGPINDDVARQEFDDCIRQFNAGLEEARMAIAALAVAADAADAADAAAAAPHITLSFDAVPDLSLVGGGVSDDCIRQFNAGSEEAFMAIVALPAAADAAAASHFVRTEIFNELDLSLDGGSLVGQPGKKRTFSGRDASSADSSSVFDSQSVTSVVSDDGSFSGSSTGSNSPFNDRSTHRCTTCGTMSVIDDDPSSTGSTPFNGWRVYWCSCGHQSFINYGPSTGRDLGEAEPSAKRQRIVGPSERDSSASDCLAISDFAFPAWQ